MVVPVICDTVWKQGTGLMFRFPKGDFAYIFPFQHPRKIAITMFCVFFPIDIVVFDEHYRVCAVVKELKPFRNTLVFGQGFVELPAGSIVKKKIRLGQKVSWNAHSWQVS